MEHLDAEILAAPLTMPSAFTSSLCRLDHKLEGPSLDLWRDTEKVICTTFPGFSLDEIIVRRDAIWFGNPERIGRLSLSDYFRNASAHFFDAGSGANPLFAPHKRHDRDLRREWRWVRFALPGDFLLAAMGKSTVPREFVSRVLQRTLEDAGFAETHLHLKAAIDFPGLWRSLQEELAGTRFKEGSMLSAGADFEEGKTFALWLLRSSTVRVVLAEYLSSPLYRRTKFKDFLRKVYFPRFLISHGPIATSALHSVIKDLAQGKLSSTSPPYARARMIYQQVANISSLIGSGNGVDPIARWFSDVESVGSEHPYLLAAFDHFSLPIGNDDSIFARLFWQAQRVRTRFYRHIIQRPLIPGLQFFTRTYSRLSAPRKALNVPTFVRSATRLAGAGLRSLEVRVVPESSVDENLKILRDFHEACLTDGPEEAGIVFHFSKSRGKDTERGRPASWGLEGNDNPEKNAHSYRFANFYRENSQQAAALGEVIQLYPGILERIRAIDICTDELGVPLWVLKPLVEYVREAARRSAKRGSTMKIPLLPLRTTIHVGEDFVHLLGGVRRIAEVVHYLSLTDGDRLGHGIAIGTNVCTWVDNTPSVAMSSAERMFDLVWARRTFIDCGHGAHLRLIEIEIERIANKVFDRPVSLTEIDDFAAALHRTSTLRDVGFPSGSLRRSHARPEIQLVQDWLTNQAVFRRSQAIVCVQTLPEMQMVQDLQDLVRSEVAAKGIVVEINPVSNLLIGNLGDLTNHPLWRLNPPGPAHGQDPIRVCVGSDDPMSFASSLMEEYQLLADSIVEAGLSAQDADAWLSRARQAGMEARFTLKPSNRNPFTPVTPTPPLLPLPL